MKARILGFLFVFAILALLFILTEGNDKNTSSQPIQIPSTSSPDADFKNLKIQ